MVALHPVTGGAGPERIRNGQNGIMRPAGATDRNPV